MSYSDKQVQFIVEAREFSEESWEEIRERFNDKFNENKTADAIRKTYRRYSNFEISDDVVIKNLMTTHRARKTNSKIRKENKIILEELTAQEDFLQEFEKNLKKIKINLHKKVKLPKKKKTKRCVLAHLSDIHIESNIEEDEMGGLNKYGRQEQARRLALFFKQVSEYKADHRNETELKLVINGDILQGLIHGIEHTTPMTTQVSAGIHLLTQGISFVSQFFCSVEVIFTVGNHGRVVHLKDTGRATSNKWDNYSTLVGIGIKYFLNSYKNVKISMPTTPYAYTKILGHDFLITHGDTVINPGNVGKSISTEKLNNKINNLMTGIGNIDALLLGHVHVPAYTILNNGVYLAVNGCVSGVDPFCQSIGILRNTAIQQIFEVTKNHPIGDMRFVNLLEADSNKDLDKIIKPFSGKF